MVAEITSDYDSQWAAMCAVAGVDEGIDPPVGSVGDAYDCEHLPVAAAAV